MEIVYWSDYACPYCLIGEARLNKAIGELGLAGKIKLVPKAFELDPSASTTVESDTITRFGRKYGMTPEQAKAQVEQISSLGREEGIDFRYATTQYTNTFDAHRLMKMALATGNEEIANKTNDLLFAAYFTENKRLADHDVLVEVGTKAGLDPEAVKKMLAGNEFVSAVRADEAEAARMGIRGVPFFVFPGGTTIPGATSVENFKQVLKEADHYNTRIETHQCGPDGCKLS